VANESHTLEAIAANALLDLLEKHTNKLHILDSRAASALHYLLEK